MILVYFLFTDEPDINPLPMVSSEYDMDGVYIYIYIYIYIMYVCMYIYIRM